MSPLPTISIVTPSFNQATFLEETMASVLSQKYPRLEYVVIDGGSTDGSVEIIKKHVLALHYWVSEKDSGHAEAINKGFSHTSGEIMAWINSDDKYLPWTFEVVAEIFATFPQVNWICGFNSWWSSRGFMTAAARNPKNIYDYLLGNYRWIQQESVFWRRSLWERAGGRINPDFKLMVDGDLWSRFFLYDDLYSVDCILAGYRVHGANRAKENHARCLAEMEQAITEMKGKCPPEVLQVYSRLKMLKDLKQAPVLGHLPVSGIGRRLRPVAFGEAAYRNLAFEDGRWQERRLPFSL